MTADLLEATTPSDQRPSESPARRTRRAAFWTIGGVVAVAAVVAAVALTRSGDTGPHKIDQSGYAPVQTLPPVGPGSPVSFQPNAVAAGTPATTPVAAVSTYFEREIAGDFIGSFEELSTDDRAGFGTAEDWEATHDELPTYLTYSIVSATDAQVVVEVTIEPQVNEIVGVVPGSARLTIPVLREDGAVRIDLADTKVEPHSPADADAAPAAAAWVAARQACDTTGTGEFGGTLVGDLGLPERLCHATGMPAAGTVSPLSALRDPTFVVSAFGSGATEWGRVVAVSGVSGADHIDVILAPYGDHWVVIGASSGA